MARKSEVINKARKENGRNDDNKDTKERKETKYYEKTIIRREKQLGNQ